MKKRMTLEELDAYYYKTCLPRVEGVKVLENGFLAPCRLTSEIESLRKKTRSIYDQIDKKNIHNSIFKPLFILLVLSVIFFLFLELSFIFFLVYSCITTLILYAIISYKINSLIIKTIEPTIQSYINDCLLQNLDDIYIPIPLSKISISKNLEKYIRNIVKKEYNELVTVKSTEIITKNLAIHGDLYDLGLKVSIITKNKELLYNLLYKKNKGIDPFPNEAKTGSITTKIVYSTDKLNTCIIEANKAGYKLNQVKEQHKFIYSKFICVFEKI